MKTIEPPVRSEVDTFDSVGTSRKLITCSRKNRLLPSVHAVMSNDDLLIEILLKLPIVSLYMLKSVSKRWLSLITNTDFIKRRSQIPKVDPPSSLFLPRQCVPFSGYDFLPLDAKVSASIQSLTKEDGKFIIMQSCNGLLLCCIKPDKFYVYNPCLNMFKMLPDCNNLFLDPFLYVGGVRMAFDPTKSHHYKVFRAGQKTDDNGSVSIQIETYSSETCNWSVCGDRFLVEVFRGFQHGIYWNGAIHWLNFGNDQTLHYKLDIEKHPVLTNVLIPLTADGKVHYYLKLFESCGSLLLLCRHRFTSQHLNIYEMRNGYSEWSVKLLVNRDDIMMPFSKIRGTRVRPGVSSVRSIVLGEREEDSFMLINLEGTVVLYKLVSGTICTLCYSTSLSPSHIFQFIASFFAV